MNGRQELIDLVCDLGHDRVERLLNIHRTTLARWLSGKSRIPNAALLTLRGACKGQLPGMTDKEWEGWYFGRDGRLYSPDNYPYHSGDLMSYRLQGQLINALKAKVQDLENKVSKMTAELEKVDPAANQRAYG